MPPSPIALAAYESLAESYAARIDTKPHNAFYERPATLSLLPEVRDLRVLDAGCGPGVYTRWLADHGADVLAIDVSSKMLALAQKRLGGRAAFRVADLGEPLDFLPDQAFDLVLSALALDYVGDWSRVFREFFRLLVPCGYLIFSASHPFADFLHYPTGRYFDTELVEMEWTGFGTPVRVPCYRRPLQAVLNPLLQAGFTLETILEPTPTDEFKAADPVDYAELSTRPGFLCIRARKS